MIEAMSILGFHLGSFTAKRECTAIALFRPDFDANEMVNLHLYFHDCKEFLLNSNSDLVFEEIKKHTFEKVDHYFNFLISNEYFEISIKCGGFHCFSHFSKFTRN